MEFFIFNVDKRKIMWCVFGFKDDEYVVGYIGIFMEVKNYFFFIEVFVKYYVL